MKSSLRDSSAFIDHALGALATAHAGNIFPTCSKRVSNGHVKPSHAHPASHEVACSPRTNSFNDAATKLKGEGSYRARCGVSVDPYGVFLVEIAGVTNGGFVLIRNVPELGDAPIPKLSIQSIEDRYLYAAHRPHSPRRELFP
jgi:hypothetical protein